MSLHIITPLIFSGVFILHPDSVDKMFSGCYHEEKSTGVL